MRKRTLLISVAMALVAGLLLIAGTIVAKDDGNGSWRGHQGTPVKFWLMDSGNLGYPPDPPELGPEGRATFDGWAKYDEDGQVVDLSDLNGFLRIGEMQRHLTVRTPGHVWQEPHMKPP